jgi:hypothetical protein
MNAAVALKIVAEILDRNTRYIGIDLARGMFASIETELLHQQPKADDAPQTDPDSL